MTTLGQSCIRRVAARVAYTISVALIAATSLLGQQAPVALTFLDVGQGDAIVIRAPDGRFAMVDAGRGSPLRQLTRLGVQELALVVASHAHADHIGGLDDVLTARPVETYLDNGTPHTTETYRELMAHVERLEVRYLEAVPRSLFLGEVAVEVWPLPRSSDGQNNRSVGLLVRYGDFAAILTGDSERSELDFWLNEGVVEDVTLLKAPHHGAVNGFTYEFLEATDPEVVVISVGEDNSYGHPRPEALAAYTSFADRVLRTDRDGTVTVLGYADGRHDVVLGDTPYVDMARRSVQRVDSSVGEYGETRMGTGLSDILSVTVHPDAGGDDWENLNDEYVVIENRSRTRLGIGLWKLCDLSSRCFRFPPGASIAAGRRVVVYTGYGTTDGVSFFMNNGRPVWNNDGDEATLFDSGGIAIARYVYEEE